MRSHVGRGGEGERGRESGPGCIGLSYVGMGMRVRDGHRARGSKGNFQQTAGSIGSKLEKNIRFLIETTLPKISSFPSARAVHAALLSS